MACGFSINVHYCMGEVDAIYLGNKKSETCGKCGMHTDNSKGCCKDETSIYKINDDHQQSNYDFSFTNYAVALLPTQFLTYSSPTICSNVNKSFFTDTSPPNLIKDRNILFSVFLI